MSSTGFALFADTPFPKKKLKAFLLRHHGSRSSQERYLSLKFCRARINANTRMVVARHGSNARCIRDSGRYRLEICYQISKKRDGMDRFRADMNGLHGLLVETGGYMFEKCFVLFSTRCDSLIPDVVALFSSTSQEPPCHKQLILSEREGAADPAVAANIVEKWRTGSATGQTSVRFYPNDITRHEQALEAMLTKPNVVEVFISTMHSNYPMSAEAMRLVSSIMRSSQASTLSKLSVDDVSAGAESDRALASILEANKSLTLLDVYCNSGTSWVATEILRAMRETNCFTEVRFHPASSLARTCQAEIQLYASLNKLGRKFMRNASSGAQKIPELLERVWQEEYPRCGQYLYPMLRENPSKWTSYLTRRNIQENMRKRCLSAQNEEA